MIALYRVVVARTLVRLAAVPQDLNARAARQFILVFMSIPQIVPKGINRTGHYRPHVSKLFFCKGVGDNIFSGHNYKYKSYRADGSEAPVSRARQLSCIDHSNALRPF